MKGNISFVPAIIDTGAKFDGKSWIEVNDNNSLDLYDAFTFSAWIYKENAGAGGWSVIFEKADTSATDDRSPYGFCHAPDGYNPVVNVVYNNQFTTINSDTRTNFKEWNLVSVTWDGTSVRFYINGELKTTKEWSNPLPDSSSKLLIGCGPAGMTEYFIGILDELRIYNRALDTDEIISLYNMNETLPPVPTTTTPTPQTPSLSPQASPSPLTPSPSPDTQPLPVPEPSPSESSVQIKGGHLVFESRSKQNGSELQIPLTIYDASEYIGNMDITLSYDPSVIKATDVMKGALAKDSLLDYNTAEPGIIRLSLADSTGFSGTGYSVVYIVFKVDGILGAVSPLRIIDLQANRANDSGLLDISMQDGLFSVIGNNENPGDFDGDDKLTALDALVALQMAVGKRAVDLVMDVTGDGKVTSLDAREILVAAISQPRGDDTLSGTINPVRSLSAQQRQLVDMFGWPHSFTLLEIAGDDEESHCSEAWTYYDGKTTYYFLDGEYHEWEPVDPLPEGSIATPYHPDEFLIGSSPDAVAKAVAPGDEWILAEEAGYLLESTLDDAEIYAAPQLVAGFYQDHLIFLEALALVPKGDE
jgi:hypothetical protein